jgi:serine/threonine-protein kinase
VQQQRLLDGRYRLERPIAEGGMSVVWRAYDERLDRPVAVKVLADKYAADVRCRAGIQVEAKAGARLSHPYVTAVYDYGEWTFDGGERLPYLVTELLSGQSLADLLARGALPTRTALRICAEVAEGLAAAHERGVVHRDVKPANIMMTSAGAKVFDFGIAAAVGQTDAANDQGWIMGTPSYLAPERLRGGPVVPGTDVYGLVLLMFRLLTDEPARTDAHSRPAPLPPLKAVPPEVAELYRLGIQADPDKRPSARDAAAVLRLALRRMAGTTTLRASRSAVRPPALVAACLAVLAAVVLAVVNRPAGPAQSPSVPAPAPIETVGQRPSR